MRLAPLVLVLALAPSLARADVVPYGWRPPPPREEMHVELFRASVAEWMQPDERVLLAARTHPRCVAAASRRATGFGGGRRCPSLDRIREVAVDRALRFFAAEVLDAQGRAREAAALRGAPPMRDAAARASVSTLLAGDPLAPARELAEHGMEGSLEQVSAALGRLVRAAVDAGAPRDRMTHAAIEMLAELATPLAASTAWVEPEQDADGLARLVARRAGACLQREVDARWRPVAVRVVIQGGAAGIAVSSTGPRAVRACIERAVRDGIERARAAPTAVRVIRVVAGPRGVLWGAPIELTTDG